MGYAASFAAFPRDCLCSGDNPGQDLSGISFPVVAFSASRGPQQPVPEERGVRPNRGEGNGPRKERVEAGSRVRDAHPAPWVLHPQRGLAGKSRAGCDGGRLGGGGGSPEPEMLRLGEKRGRREARRDGEDEDGQGVQVCGAGLGRGSGEAGGSVWRAPRKEDVGLEGERSAVVSTLRDRLPLPSAIAHGGISGGPRIKYSNFHYRIDYVKILRISFQTARKCFYLT